MSWSSAPSSKSMAGRLGVAHWAGYRTLRAGQLPRQRPRRPRDARDAGFSLSCHTPSEHERCLRVTASGIRRGLLTPSQAMLNDFGGISQQGQAPWTVLPSERSAVMNDFEHTNPREAVPGLSNSLNRPAWVPAGKHARRRRARRFLAYRRSGRIAAAALICAAIGLPVGVATSASATAVQVVASAASTGASNARSAPAQGGAIGTVTTVSTSSFTITTPTGQKVTVAEKSSTMYEKGTTSTSDKAVTKGQSVLVLGSVNSTTITATQIVVGYESPSSATSAAKVVPFTRGKTTAANQVGQIPANWSAGSGTIVSGTTANKATEAALAAYPGAIVDRVARLSDGEYNVHYIGVNWPHHVFESYSFKVVGAL